VLGILGEDNSDVESLKVIVRRLRKDESISIKGKGYDGCGQLLRKGARQLELLAELGCSHFIVCYDSDGHSPLSRFNEVVERVVKPAGVMEKSCIVIPVEELEAWLLADIEAVVNVCKSWRPGPIPNPERIPSPKEHLEKLSRDSKHRPRYSHAVHNEKLSKYIDLDKVSRKCPSFKPLEDFVTKRL